MVNVLITKVKKGFQTEEWNRISIDALWDQFYCHLKLMPWDWYWYCHLKIVDMLTWGCQLDIGVVNLRLSVCQSVSPSVVWGRTRDAITSKNIEIWLIYWQDKTVWFLNCSSLWPSNSSALSHCALFYQHQESSMAMYINVSKWSTVINYMNYTNAWF